MIGRACELWEHYGKRFSGGLTLYPYQLSLGISFRYWPCLFAPSIRVHVGPFKVWAAIHLKNV